MRKLVFLPSKTCHCRSVSVFWVPYGLASENVLPQSVDVATVKLSSRSMLCRPEYAIVSQPVDWSAASATEISESPPPVPRSGCWTGLWWNVTDPSWLRVFVMRQKLDPTPLGAET